VPGSNQDEKNNTKRLPQNLYLSTLIKKYTPADDESVELEEGGYHTHGFYAQEQLSYKKWSLLLGIRSELYEDADDEASDSTTDLEENMLLPRIGIVFNASKILSVYATFNKGFDPFEMSTISKHLTSRSSLL